MAIAWLILSIAICAVTFYKWKTSPYRRMPKGKKPLPGPSGLPFIGRAHDVPPEQTWLKFHEWSEKYGPIYKHEIFGTTHIWISDEGIANELIAKKGAIYSDRPMIPNLPDNKYSGAYLPLLGRNDIWVRQRKFGHQILPSSLSPPAYQPPAFIPTQERSILLHGLLQDPSSYITQIEGFTSRTISRWAWGTSSHSATLKVVTMALLTSISPSGAVPNVVTWLTHLPEWASPWKQVEAKRRVAEEKFFLEAFQGAKKRYEIGKQANVEGLRDSFVRTYLESLEGGDNIGKKSKPIVNDDKEAMYVIGMMAIAGALTIGSPLQSFILAMLEYPEWQSKLQEEIDRVCGGKVPEWEHRSQMPVLRAVVKEVCRWRAPVPTGIPHSLEQDDTFQDYFIPANSVIHAFEYAFNRNPVTYPSPHLFNPGRWLDPSYPTYKEPLSIYPNLKGYSQFGHGRRTCQGVEIVEQDLFLAMGGMAWAFNVVPKGSPEITNYVLANSTRPDCKEYSERQSDDVRGGRGGRSGKKDLEYTSLLIAKPFEFSGEFDLRVRGKERGKQIVESAIEAIREESREVFDGLGFTDDEKSSGLVTSMAEKMETVPNGNHASHDGKLSDVADESENEMMNKIEGWREKIEKRIEQEFSPIVLEKKGVVDDKESLILLNESWGQK